MPKLPQTLGEWLVAIIGGLILALMLATFVMASLWMIVSLWRMTFG